MVFSKLFIIIIITTNYSSIINLNIIVFKAPFTLSFIDWDFNIIHNFMDINSKLQNFDIITTGIIIPIHNFMDINFKQLDFDIIITVIIITHNFMDINFRQLDSDIMAASITINN